MDLGLSFTKYVLFFFNFAFVVLGIAMITIGAIVRTNFVDYREFIDYDLTPFPITLIVVGCVVFLIAFLGCCGAIKENTCMLLLYSLVVIALVAFEVGIIVYAYSKKGEIEGIVNKKIESTLTEPKTYNAWDLLQKELKCCGVTEAYDWIKVSRQIPGSCCEKPFDQTCAVTESYKDGCKLKFTEFLQSNMVRVAGIAIGVAVVQLLSIIFSCCLYSAFRRGEYRHY